MSKDTLPQLILFTAGTIFGGLVAFFTWGMLSAGDPSSRFLPFDLPYQDKILHFLAFAMMAVPSGMVLPRRYYSFILMSLVALAGGMEIAQHVSNVGREGDLADFAASSLGAIMAIGFIWCARRWWTNWRAV